MSNEEKILNLLQRMQLDITDIKSNVVELKLGQQEIKDHLYSAGY
ncbi:hypothetical protein [Marinisporobacter balticus]|uniref:Uncharacterized protein n=1 Tax=Marinisporobacter balticus TaxID=2018667 RepID=A0A4R2L1M0_9FIRM|nr:hypothetical protein [Marinisporobacter balticus]TCO79087.1 hypothetical protein EV214_103139 [Marinisporobacter balticus]